MALWGVDVGGGGGDVSVVVVSCGAVTVGRRAAPVWPKCGQAGALDGGSGGRALVVVVVDVVGLV